MISRNGVELEVGQNVLVLRTPIVGQHEFYNGVNLKVIGFPIWSEYFKYEGSFDQFPSWKSEFIKKNKKLYNDNKSFIDKWLLKHSNLDDFCQLQATVLPPIH